MERARYFDPSDQAWEVEHPPVFPADIIWPCKFCGNRASEAASRNVPHHPATHRRRQERQTAAPTAADGSSPLGGIR